MQKLLIYYQKGRDIFNEFIKIVNKSNSRDSFTINGTFF